MSDGGGVLVHSGARLPLRVWPLENFSALVARLRQKNFPVQVACDADQLAWWRARGEPAPRSGPASRPSSKNIWLPVPSFDGYLGQSAALNDNAGQPGFYGRGGLVPSPTCRNFFLSASAVTRVACGRRREASLALPGMI